MKSDRLGLRKGTLKAKHDTSRRNEGNRDGEIGRLGKQQLTEKKESLDTSIGSLKLKKVQTSPLKVGEMQFFNENDRDNLAFK